MKEAKCRARAKSGQPCHANATTDGFCSIHSSAGRAAELGRRSGISRRGPSSDPFLFSPPETARDLHRALGQIFAKVSSGQMDMRIGRSLGYIASVLVKTTELSDHEIRLRAIEQIIRSIKSGGTQE